MLIFQGACLEDGVRGSKKVCSGHLTWMICRAGLMDEKVSLANLASGDFIQQTVLVVQLSHTKEIYSAGGKR